MDFNSDGYSREVMSHAMIVFGASTKGSSVFTYSTATHPLFETGVSVFALSQGIVLSMPVSFIDAQSWITSF
jgi:hypothetical protein